jgi:hypothetical protein
MSNDDRADSAPAAEPELPIDDLTQSPHASLGGAVRGGSVQGAGAVVNQVSGASAAVAGTMGNTGAH